MVYPDFSIPFTLYTDVSGDSIGFNRTQIQHARERPIVYSRRNFSDTEKKYSITELKALSVILAIQKCRPYLLGNHFTVVVDHQALKWLMSLRDPTGRLAQWALTLQGYDFGIQYHPAKDHYQDASTPLPSNLCSQRNCVMLRTAMTNSSPLSNIWKMGLFLRTHWQLRKLCDKKANISSVTMTFYTNSQMEGKEPSFNCNTKNSTNGALTLVPWPLHEWSPWLK